MARFGLGGGRRGRARTKQGVGSPAAWRGSSSLRMSSHPCHLPPHPASCRSTATLSDEATRALAHSNAVADAPHRLEPGPQNRKYINSATKRLEALLERPGGGKAAAAAAAAAGEEGGAGAVGALAGLLARHTPAGSLPKFVEGLESRLGAGQKLQLLLNLGLLYQVGGLGGGVGWG